jgi:phenylpyruvate tautomerase PptA (4-oxalocrotonate tautomerase family)
MPYLQLDIPSCHPAAVKRDLARRLGALYGEIMQTGSDKVTVAFRELGEGSIWRCGSGNPEPSAILACDVRRGRSPGQLADLAEAVAVACVEALGLRADRFAVVFTQHPGHEVFRLGLGPIPDWTPEEARQEP